MVRTLLLVATVTVSLLLVVVLGERISNLRPFTSSKTPKETIVHYEVVRPRITYKAESQQTYPKELHVIIPTDRTNYSLVLELNKQLISPSFTSRYYDETGQEVVAKGHVNCFYQGWVESHPDWTVTMSTCRGLQGSFGDLKDKNNFFHMEPLSKEDGSMDQRHALYLDSEYKLIQGNCGSNHIHDSNERMDWPNMEELYYRAHSRLRRQSTTRIVEWIVVNDNRQYVAHGHDVETTVVRTLELANVVDMLYRQLMIRVVLVEVITWNNGDEITISSNPHTLLNSFKEYRRNISTPHDSTMLLTGIDIDDDTMGVAFTHTMCSATHSVAVTQNGGRSPSAVASTAAHELGHIFNMGHDDAGRQCSCADGDNGCIMAAVSAGSTPPTKWSSCSVSDLQTGYSMFNLDRCLFNQPTRSVGDPVCGNGIREGDEVCDCGSEQECTDPCCNAATCQLASGAQCSAGACCTSTCQFVSYGTECRAASGECDIAEYCSGDSSDCPADETKLDGTSCSGNTGYCYSGMCPTHNAQCQRAFGSNKALSECYNQLNIEGNMNGNCGHNSTAFLSCSLSNVECGQLQCMSGDLRSDNIGVAVVNATVTLGVGVCRSFTTRPGSNVDTQNPGLVEDGTRCGDGLVCLSQQCVSVSQIAKMSCEPAPNGLVCSGNGVCNNHRKCSCFVDFTGTSCQTQVPVNDPSPFNDTTGSGGALLAGIAAMVGALLLIMIVLTIIIFLITLNIRRGFPKENTSGFKSHYSVVYHTSSAMERETSEDILPDMVQPCKKDIEISARSSVSLSTVEKSAVPRNDDDSVEMVPVRPAPQRPPTRKPPPVPTAAPHSAAIVGQSDQNHSMADTSHNKTSTEGEQNTAAVVTPTDSKSHTPPTQAEQQQHIQTPSLKEDRLISSTNTQSQPHLKDTSAIIDALHPQTSQTPMAPRAPNVEKPSAPPRQNVPIKPAPVSKPAPAPKSAPVSAPKPLSPSATSSEGAAAPAPKPKPKVKPLVPAEKPVVKPDKVVPPKPSMKPTGLESSMPNKPKPAPKPTVATTKPAVATDKPPVATVPKPKTPLAEVTAATSIDVRDPKPPVAAIKPTIKPAVIVPKPTAGTRPTAGLPPKPPTAPKPQVATAPKSPTALTPKPVVGTKPAAKPPVPKAKPPVAPRSGTTPKKSVSSPEHKLPDVLSTTKKPIVLPRKET